MLQNPNEIFILQDVIIGLHPMLIWYLLGTFQCLFINTNMVETLYDNLFLCRLIYLDVST